MDNEFIFYAPGNEFLMPYIEHELGKSPAPSAIMISSTDIYEPHPDEILDETAPLRTGSPWIERENDFLRAHPGGVILRAAPIVGTGMEGAMRRLASEIYAGRFFHFPGNETRKSVVHAVDIATVTGLIVHNGITEENDRVYNLTDNTDPTLHDLAEAFAYRMGNKRISNISTRPQQILARWLYGKRYTYYTTDERFRSNKIRNALNYNPTDVCTYLRTHVYDETSL